MTPSDPPAKPDSDDVLSSLPRSRPQRRSSKRDGASPTAGKPTPARTTHSKAGRPSPPRKRAPAKPAATDAAKPPRTQPDAVRPSAATRNARSSAVPPRRGAPPPTGVHLIGTAVAAAGELAELGLSLGARTLRKIAARVPRP